MPAGREELTYKPIKRFAPEGVYDSRPLGFTQLLTVSRAKLVVMSGLVAFDKDLKLIGATVPEQLTATLANAQAALATVGAGPEHITQVRIYVVGLSPEVMPGIQAALRNPDFPLDQACSTLLGVAALARPDVLVEVEMTAAIDE